MDDTQLAIRTENMRKKMAKEDISKHNLEKIFEFVRYQKLSGKVKSGNRILKVIYTLRLIGKWATKDFEKMTKEDILSLLEKAYKEPYSANTKTDIVKILKCFWRWLKGKKNPEEIEDIKALNPMNIKRPGDMLTQAEITEIVKREPNIRNRAIIMTLYETGMRIGEFLSLRICDITQEDKDIWFVSCNESKTIERSVPVVDSIPYLQAWLNIHPDQKKDSPLGFNLQQQRGMDYRNTAEMLKAAVRRAKISKPGNPHAFRHAAVTRDASSFSDAELKLKYGWSPDSKQLRTYSHLSSRSLVNAEKRRRGMLEEKPEVALAPKICEKCKAKNPHTAKFCECGFPLDMAEIMKERAEDENMQRFAIGFIEDCAAKYGDDAIRQMLKARMEKMRIRI